MLQAAVALVALATGLGGLELGEQLSIPGVYGPVPSAEAVVGRPLTPVSVAPASAAGPFGAARWASTTADGALLNQALTTRDDGRRPDWIVRQQVETVDGGLKPYPFDIVSHRWHRSEDPKTVSNHGPATRCMFSSCKRLGSYPYMFGG